MMSLINEDFLSRVDDWQDREAKHTCGASEIISVCRGHCGSRRRRLRGERLDRRDQWLVSMHDAIPRCPVLAELDVEGEFPWSERDCLEAVVV